MGVRIIPAILGRILEMLRSHLPASPPLIGFEGIDADRRETNEEPPEGEPGEHQRLLYVLWPDR